MIIAVVTAKNMSRTAWEVRLTRCRGHHGRWGALLPWFSYTVVSATLGYRLDEAFDQGSNTFCWWSKSPNGAGPDRSPIIFGLGKPLTCICRPLPRHWVMMEFASVVVFSSPSYLAYQEETTVFISCTPAGVVTRGRRIQLRRS